MRAIVAVASALASLFVLGACTSPSDTNNSAYEKVPLKDAQDAGEIVKRTRFVGLEMLTQEPGQNMVLSPASTVIALTVLGQNAQGTTDEQLTELLGATGEARDQAVNALIGALDDFQTDPKEIDTDKLPEQPQLNVANQIVANKGTDIESSYTDALKHWFKTEIDTADLTSSSGKKTLDAWIDKNTGGLIKESGIEPNEDLRLVVQNAVLFASRWEPKFMQLGERDFDGAGGKETGEYFGAITKLPYSELEDWQMVEIPYTDGKFSAQIVLPPEGTDPSAITLGELATMEIGLEEHMVDLALPKLDLQNQVDLKAPLEGMGFTAVFNGQPAPLKNISENADLYVGQALQQSHLIMNEEGTFAAAATEMGLVGVSADVSEPEIQFTADRPFMVIIRESNTGWDLFQATINSLEG